MTSPRENRPALLAAVLAHALPGAAPHRIADAVTAMTAAAKAHKRAAEHECSYPTDETWQRRTEARLSRLADCAKAKIYAAASSAYDAQGFPQDIRPYLGPAGLVVRLPTRAHNATSGDRSILLKFGGDPRGPGGVLFISDRDGDSWDEHNGRRGWAIYE